MCSEAGGAGQRQEFPIQFLSSFLCKAVLGPGEVAELVPQAQEGEMNSHLVTILLSHKLVCFGYTEKFQLFFAAFKTVGCGGLASRGRFAEGPRKGDIVRKHR